MPLATDQAIELGTLESLRAQMKISKSELATMVGVDPSTIWRWTGEERVPRGLAAIRIIQILEVGELLRQLFAGPDRAREWLRMAKPASLGGTVTPIDVMLEGRVDRVLAVLEFLARGA